MHGTSREDAYRSLIAAEEARSSRPDSKMTADRMELLHLVHEASAADQRCTPSVLCTSGSVRAAWTLERNLSLRQGAGLDRDLAAAKEVPRAPKLGGALEMQLTLSEIASFCPSAQFSGSSLVRLGAESPWFQCEQLLAMTSALPPDTPHSQI